MHIASSSEAERCDLNLPDDEYNMRANAMGCFMSNNITIFTPSRPLQLREDLKNL